MGAICKKKTNSSELIKQNEQNRTLAWMDCAYVMLDV